MIDLKTSDYVMDWMDEARFIVSLTDRFPDDWKSKKLPFNAGRTAMFEPEVKEKWCWL